MTDCRFVFRTVGYTEEEDRAENHEVPCVQSLSNGWWSLHRRRAVVVIHRAFSKAITPCDPHPTGLLFLDEDDIVLLVLQFFSFFIFVMNLYFYLFILVFIELIVLNTSTYKYTKYIVIQL